MVGWELLPRTCPPPCPLSGATGAIGAPVALLWGQGRGRGGSRCRNVVGPTFIPLPLVRPEENSTGGRGIEVGVIAPAISPLTPAPPILDTDQEAQKVGVLDGEGGGDGAGGASRIILEKYLFKDWCAPRCSL